DILTNYYISLLPETVSVKVSGRATIVIDEMRLCTIYSNLLQNAVEELLRIQGDKASLLEISFQKGEKFFRIVIKNSLSEQQTDVAELETKKTDKRNHGIGLQNVRRAVETIGGRLEIKKKNDYFEAVVDLRVDNC
ncbi:MAG: GHKL domain-containing protein, partial [Acetatifactor sp.]